MSSNPGMRRAGLSIQVNGSELSNEDLARIEEVSITDGLKQPGTFDLRYNMAEWPDGAWHGGEGNPFRIGDEIRISFGFDSVKVFAGYVASLQADFGSEPALTVNGYDPLYKLQFGTRLRSFQWMTDSEVVEMVALEDGLVPDVEPTTEVRNYIFQNNVSDFEFINQRADANQFDFLYVNERLKFYSSLVNMFFEELVGINGPQLRYKADFDQFQGTVNSQALGSAVIVQGYDSAQGTPIFGIYGANLAETAAAGLQAELAAASGLAMAAVAEPGSVEEISGTLADATASIVQAEADALSFQAELGMTGRLNNFAGKFRNNSPIYITDKGVGSQAEAEAVAVAKYQELLQPYIEGSGNGVGNPDLQAGIHISLTGLGKQFSGPYYCTGTTHTFDMQQGYTTSFQVRRKWFEAGEGV